MTTTTSTTTSDMTTSQEKQTANSKVMRRVALSVLLGTTIEWYDFFLFASAAALVFGPLYFPGHEPVTATLLAFGTFAAGFVARPLGGIVLGHFGDRVGRKKMLVLSLTMMGVATFLMGLVPTYATIGVAAPIILVLLRFVQGLGLGGEWGGAVLTAVEYSRPATRGFYGSLPQIGVPAGLFLATAAVIGVSQLPEDAFMEWGWRVPFLASIVLVGIGLWVRSQLEETPVFAKMRASTQPARVPLLEAVRAYPKQILLAIGSILGAGPFWYGLTTFALSYAKTEGTASRTAMLVGVLASAVVSAAALPYFGTIAQRYGRRRIILIGIAAMAVWIFPTFLAIDSGNAGWIIAAYIVGGAVFSISYGPAATFISELFDARVRFSASSTSYQFGALLGGATAPLVLTALVAATGTSMAVAGYVVAVCVVSFISVLLVSQRDLDRGSSDLDGDAQRAAPDTTT
jgi:MHS family shikimate/dehydroshikimate transporter-like MFS transporter